MRSIELRSRGLVPRRHSSRGGRGHLLPDGALMIAQRPRWVGNANCRLSGSASERRGGTRHSPLTCRRLPLSTASDALNVELPWLSIRFPSESRAYESAYYEQLPQKPHQQSSAPSDANATRFDRRSTAITTSQCVLHIAHKSGQKVEQHCWALLKTNMPAAWQHCEARCRSA